MQTMKISDQINVTFTDLQEKFITMLIEQACRHDMKDKLISELKTNDILTLLESREIYLSMFGYQFAEEKEMLPKLLSVFKYKKEFETRGNPV
jgi:hypothetical protein